MLFHNKNNNNDGGRTCYVVTTAATDSCTTYLLTLQAETHATQCRVQHISDLRGGKKEKYTCSKSAPNQSNDHTRSRSLHRGVNNGNHLLK